MFKQRIIRLKGSLFVALIAIYSVFYFLRLIESFSWWNLVFIPLTGAITAFVFLRLNHWEEFSFFWQQCREDWGGIVLLGIVLFASFWSLNGRYRYVTPIYVYAEHILKICPTLDQKQYRVTNIHTKGFTLYKQPRTNFINRLRPGEENCQILEAAWDGPIYLEINTQGKETLNASIWLDNVQFPPEKPEGGKVTQILSGTRGDLLGKKSFGIYWGTFILVVGLLGWLTILIAFFLYFMLARAFLASGESFSGNLPSQIDSLVKEISREFHQRLPELVVLIVIIAAAYGLYFTNNLMMGDDWILIRGPFSDLQGGIGKGRWLREMMRYVYDRGFPMPTVTLALALIGCLVSARIQAAVIGLNTRFSIFSYVAVFVLYPIWTEPMMFNLERGTILVGMIVIALSTYLIIPMYERFIEKKFLPGSVLLFTSALLFSIVAAGGQNFVFIGVETFLFALLLKTIEMQKNRSLNFKLLAGHFIALTAVVIVGLILYFLEFKFSLSFYQITESTGNYSLTGTLISSWPALIETLDQFWSIFVQYLFLEQYFLPAFTKYIFLVFLVTIPILFIFRLVANYKLSQREKILSAVYFVFFWVLLFLTPWGIALIRNADHWNTYRYNAMLQLATFAAGMIAISLELIQRYWWQKLVQALTLILIVVYAFQINKASVIMYYNNQRDLAIAQRVLTRIEMLPNYDQIQKVNLLILGAGEMDVQQGRIFDVIGGDNQLETKMGNLASGCGVWDCQPYRTPELLWLLSSQNKEFERLTLDRYTTKTRDLLVESFKENPMHPWPAEDSIRVLADHTIVLFVSGNRNQDLWSKIYGDAK